MSINTFSTDDSLRTAAPGHPGLGNAGPRKPGGDKTQTILVVEDDTPIREMISFLLEAQGYSVLKARHSREALFFENEFAGDIHLLLTDFCMRPYANGHELARQIRVNRPGIRVMYISGFVEDNSLQHELETEEAVFLAKPFSPNALLACVRKMLSIIA
jgi:DNA-binding response OmpR family regulator